MAQAWPVWPLSLPKVTVLALLVPRQANSFLDANYALIWWFSPLDTALLIFVTTTWIVGALARLKIPVLAVSVLIQTSPVFATNGTKFRRLLSGNAALDVFTIAWACQIWCFPRVEISAFAVLAHIQANAFLVANCARIGLFRAWDTALHIFMTAARPAWRFARFKVSVLTSLILV